MSRLYFILFFSPVGELLVFVSLLCPNSRQHPGIYPQLFPVSLRISGNLVIQEDTFVWNHM